MSNSINKNPKGLLRQLIEREKEREELKKLDLEALSHFIDILISGKRSEENEY